MLGGLRRTLVTEEGEASSIRTGLVLRPATSCLVLNSSPGFLQFYDPVSGLLSEEVRVDSCDMFVCYPSVCSSVICLFVCVVGCGWAELCLQNRSEADSAHVSGPRQLHTVRRLDGYCKQCSPPPPFNPSGLIASMATPSPSFISYVPPLKDTSNSVWPH